MLSIGKLTSGRADYHVEQLPTGGDEYYLRGDQEDLGFAPAVREVIYTTNAIGERPHPQGREGPGATSRPRPLPSSACTWHS